jgi:hypothetical protein
LGFIHARSIYDESVARRVEDQVEDFFEASGADTPSEFLEEVDGFNSLRVARSRWSAGTRATDDDVSLNIVD